MMPNSALKAAAGCRTRSTAPARRHRCLRTRLAAIEQEKLGRYQQRYEEYIKTAKAIAAYGEIDGENVKILIVGGTIFLGRALVDAAFARGHEVTTFSRGRHNPDTRRACRSKR